VLINALTETTSIRWMSRIGIVTSYRGLRELVRRGFQGSNPAAATLSINSNWLFRLREFGFGSIVDMKIGSMAWRPRRCERVTRWVVADGSQEWLVDLGTASEGPFLNWVSENY
jgi:hypothetical protein